MGFMCAINIFAQPVVTPKNLALGGGGTTYITDFHANFYNPANLLINDRTKKVDIGFLSGTSTFNGVLNFENPLDQKIIISSILISSLPATLTLLRQTKILSLIPIIKEKD